MVIFMALFNLVIAFVTLAIVVVFCALYSMPPPDYELVLVYSLLSQLVSFFFAYGLPYLCEKFIAWVDSKIRS